MQDRKSSHHQISYALYKLTFDYKLIRSFSEFNWHQSYIKQNRKLKINHSLPYFLNSVIILTGYLLGNKIFDYLEKN